MPSASQSRKLAAQARREARAKKQAQAARNHERYVQKTYNLKAGQYQEMLAAQDGRCAICMRVARTRRLAVDHDHFTGLPRGTLLCYLCNKYLGQWESDPIALHNLIQYAQGIIRDLGGLPEPGLPKLLPVASE